VERRQWSGVTSLEEMRCSQARRAPFIYTEVKAGATRHGFDVQRKTGGGGRSNRRASQQVEGTAKLQDPEDRAELNRRVRECERKYYVSGRLGSIQQARVCTRQQAIFHPRQPSPTNFFVILRISSSLSSSYRRQSYSPREFTFRVFFFITKATPRFALIHWIFLMPATPLPEYHR
jgi:hypothetical protein